MTAQALLSRGFLPPLRDAHGEAFDPAQLACSTDPQRWDEDASKAHRLAAAQLCWQCPALRPCEARRVALGELATGVWATVMLPRRKTTPTLYDATVAYWAAMSGTVIEGAQG